MVEIEVDNESLLTTQTYSELKVDYPFIKKCEIESDYIYDRNGYLKHKVTNKKFIFSNQDEYDKVGKYVIAYVKSILLDNHKMRQLWLPSSTKILRDFNSYFNPNLSHPQADIYISKDFLENNGKLLCLVQGTGKVKAGYLTHLLRIWSRAVCINDNINNGSVLPFLELAEKYKMAVIIFNPNERRDPRTGKEIQEFSTMEKHCIYVWENVVEKFSKAKEIYFVSHSMGGFCTIEIMKKYSTSFKNKVTKIAFTDSVHGKRPRILDKNTLKHLEKNSVNFVKSKQPLGTFIDDQVSSGDYVVNISAGHELHEFTTGCAFPEIEKFFFDENYLDGKRKSIKKTIVKKDKF